jgi:hypothetical protein
MRGNIENIYPIRAEFRINYVKTKDFNCNRPKILMFSRVFMVHSIEMSRVKERDVKTLV